MKLLLKYTIHDMDIIFKLTYFTRIKVIFKQIIRWCWSSQRLCLRSYHICIMHFCILCFKKCNYFSNFIEKRKYFILKIWLESMNLIIQVIHFIMYILFKIRPIFRIPAFVWFVRVCSIRSTNSIDKHQECRSSLQLFEIGAP